MIMPNFLVIGAAKAGTSSLHYYLKQHPQIFMPDLKEPRFFALEDQTLNFRNPDQTINHDSITNLYDYTELFREVSDEVAIGEASPLYLYRKEAAERIKHYIPNAKLITVLRNPVERAFSSYAHLRREGYESLSFEEALKVEQARIDNNWAHLWHYTKAGFYSTQLKPFYELFSRKQNKIILFDELCNDVFSSLKEIFFFLEVDPNFCPDLTRQNVSGLPKSMIIQKFFSRKNSIRTVIQSVIPHNLRHTVAKQIKQWNVGKKPSLDVGTRAYLKALYRDDILRLQDMIDKDLSAWL